jgi:hypothetical protein
MLANLLEQPARTAAALPDSLPEAPAPVGMPSSDVQGSAAHIARLLLRIDAALSQVVRRARGEQQ